MATQSFCRMLGLFLILATVPAFAIDICVFSGGSNLPFNLTSPEYPDPYETDLSCSVTLETSSNRRLRLSLEYVNFTDAGDSLMVVDQNGIQTWVTGTSLPKDFIGSSFEITLTTDNVNTPGSGFRMLIDEYFRDEIPDKHYMHQVDLKPGKALHLYTNDYPMLYDDNSHYFWNLTSSSNNMLISVVDMDTEAQRDWLEVVGYANGVGEQLLYYSGTPSDGGVEQISVQDADYVTFEFRSDYSRNGRGFHIIVEPDSFIPMSTMDDHVPITACGGNFMLGTEELAFHLPEDSADLYCVWRIENSQPDTRIELTMYSSDFEEGTDYFQVSTGLDPSDWQSYRRRLTGAVTYEHLFIDAGSVSFVFSSGSANISRPFHLLVSQVKDYGCSGELDLTRNGRGTISIGDLPANLTSAYCRWLIKTPLQTNVNFRVDSLQSEDYYDIMEVGMGSNPSDVASRQKLLVGNVMDQTFSTYSGDMWLVFSAEDLAAEDDVMISLSLDDNACRIKTVLELSGEIDSPQLSSGLYPDDSDCQWIIQVRGGFQLRLRFLEFDLEYGHDQLIIGGTQPDEEDVDSAYLVLTGSEIPDDVVSRYNGLNLRFKTDSSVARSGFKMVFEEFFDCPDGYEYNPTNDTCYKFVTEKTSWWEARQDCDNVPDGDLVVVNDEEENEYVWNKMLSLQEGNETEQWWIGFYDAAINGQWSWVDCEETGLFGQTNWQIGAPNDNDDDHCAYINGVNGLYNDDQCNNNRSYVCEITRKNYVDSDCYPSNFRVVDTTFTQVSLTFIVSDFACDVSGYYVRHNTSDPEEFVETYLAGVLNNSVIIGGLEHGKTYLFEITTCTLTYGCYGYSTSRSVLATTEACDDDFPIGVENTCYHVSSASETWVNARRACIDLAEDAEMVNIKSEGQNEGLRQYLGSGFYWIGLYDVVEEGEFFWTAECELPDDYTNWNGTNHPKNDDEECVSMDAEGFWHDNDCDSLLAGYVCEQTDRRFNFNPVAIEPTLFRGTAYNESTVDLTWVPADNTCDIFGYTVEVDPVTEIYVEGGETSSLRVTGLSKGVIYTFRILVNSFSFDGLVGPRSTEVQTLGCPLGYAASPEGTCYRYVEITTTRSQARAQCNSLVGADLVSINDRTEFDYLMGVSRVDSWVGLSDSEVEGSFDWVDCSNPIGPWSIPTGNNDDRDCVILDLVDGLVAKNCSAEYGFVCEYNEEFDRNPSNFMGTAVSATEVTLTWTVSDNLCAVTGYRVQYTDLDTVQSEVQVEGANTESVEVINLDKATSYYFTIAPMIGEVPYPQSEPINVTTPAGPPCPPDYEQGPDGFCYFFSMDFHTWATARAHCLESEDGDLVEITDAVLSDYLISQTGNGIYWIGLYDVANEGDWRWGSECAEPPYERWAEGAPGNGGVVDEDCASMSGTTGDWDDQVCETTLLYVCQTKPRADSVSLSPSSVQPIAATPSSAIVTWTPSTRQCDIVAYEVGWLGQDGMSGQQTVAGGDSSYTIINNLTPNTGYVVFIDTVTYTSGNIGNSAGYEFATVDYCPDDYVYGNGGCYKFVRTQIEYEYARDECRRTEGGDLVVIETPAERAYVLNMTGGGDWWVGLYDSGTEGTFRWVDCSELNLWQTSNWAEGQPDDSSGAQDCGQMISSGEWMDWECDRPNQYVCEIHPIALIPKVESPSDFTATALSMVSIGLTWVPSDFNCDVLGYRILVQQGLQTFTVDVEGGDRSAYIVNDLRMDTEYSFRIAALTLSGPLAYGEEVVASTNSELADCPEGYEEGFMDSCYRFVKGSFTWEQARLECSKDFGGELVVVNNQFEQEYIVNRTIEGDWWIGLHDIATEGTFRWTDCSEMTIWQMSNWAPGQPDPETGNDQDCVQMIIGGQWMDWPCNRPNQFICEIFAKDYVPQQYAPANFSGEGISDASILLTWEPSDYLCDIAGYSIKYTDLLVDGEVSVQGGDADMVVINGLRASTTYRFSIKPLLIVDRQLDYGIAIEVATIQFAGCEEELVYLSAPGNISSPYFLERNYPPNVDCVYTITLETRVLLTFQLLFAIPDENDYLGISELEEDGYVEKVRLSGLGIPKQYISMSNSVQLQFVTNGRVEGPGFWLVFAEYDVELPVEEPCTEMITLKQGPVPLLFATPGYPTGYDNYQACNWVLQQSGSATTAGAGIAAEENLIELVFNDLDLEESYDYLVIGRGSNPANASTEIGRFTGNDVPSLQYVDDAVWLRLETDSSNSGVVRGFSFGATEKTPDQIPVNKLPAPIINPPWNGTCGSTIPIPAGTGVVLVSSPNYPSPYPENAQCVWYLEAQQGRFRISVDELMTETGYDIVEIGRGSDASDATTRYTTLSGTIDDDFSLVVEESVAWIRFTSDYSVSDMGFRFFVQQDVDCAETLVVTALDRTISSRNFPLPYDPNEYCVWSVLGSSFLPLRAVVNYFNTEMEYDRVDVGRGPASLAGNLNTRSMQLSGFVNESFTTNSVSMWLAFSSDASNQFGGFEIAFFDDMCSTETLTGASGTIASPGYGIQYPNGAECSWVIQVDALYNIRLTFNGFDLERGHDTLTVAGVRDNGVVVLTGSDLPGELVSIGSNMQINFNADLSGTGLGFSLDYQRFYDCPEGFVEAEPHGPTCYKIVNEIKTWVHARQDCRSTPGADLIIIENALENKFVREVSGGEDWWIGLYDGGTEGTFRFVECNTSTNGWAVYNWGDDQPSRTPGNIEDCVYIKGADGYFFDERCDVAKKYICETLKGTDVIPDAYYPTNFQGEALSPNDIRLTLDQSIYRCDVTGYTIAYTAPGETGGVVSIANGAGQGTVDVTGLTSDKNYTFTLNTETFSFGTLSETADTVVETLEDGETNCPPNYIQGPDFTCWRFSTTAETWYDARNLCQEDDPNSDLAVIDTIDEFNVVNATSNNSPYWIGMSDLSQERSFSWVDCQALQTWQSLNWAPGQPTDPDGSRDCVQMTRSGQWDDTLCENIRPYICKVQPKGFTEEDQYPLTFSVEATSALTARATWVPAPNRCNILGYYLIASDGGINDDVIIDVVGASSLQGEITGLRPDFFYVVSIAPYTAQGVLETRFHTTIQTFNESTICPPGYEIGYQYGCYKFVTDAKDWADARADCLGAPNGDLAIVDTQDEMTFIEDYGFGGLDWWIGLYDQAQEGTWRWVDCSDLSIWAQDQWDLGQPSDVDGSENCGQLQDNSKFNDRSCDRLLPYVCEITIKEFTPEDVDPTLFMGTSPSPTTVLLTWRPSDYNCDITGYTISYNNNGAVMVNVPGADSMNQLINDLDEETDYTFTLRAYTTMGPRNATSRTTVTTQPPENPCEKAEEGWFVGYGGRCYKVAKLLRTWDEARADCMSVTDGDLVIIETADENQYILNATLGNDYWIGFYDKANEGAWSWVDCAADTTYAYSNWAPGQPNDLDGSQDCGQVTNFGEFNDWECSRTMMYICEVSPKGYLPIFANPTRFEGAAINPNAVTLTWVPSNQFSCDVVAYRISYLEPGSPEPTSVDVVGALSATITIDQLQDGVTYNFSIAAVLAAGPVQSAQSAIVETPSLADLCEPGWESGYNYQCYKFSRSQVSWDEARADCQSVANGDLVIIETEAEFDFVRSQAPENDWWIGLYDKGTEGSFVWVDCQITAPWVRDNWASGQPNDLSGSQDCVQMLNAGTWNDWECSNPGQYICEVSPKEWSYIDQNPTLLRGEAVDPNTIQLNWRPSASNCEVAGYRVYVIVEPDGEAYSVDIADGDTNIALLKNLETNTVYTFDIAAILASSEILPPVGTVVRIDTPASGQCGNTEFLLESGFILSPNYPEPYPNSQDCLYTITLPNSAQVIRITMETLDLEPGQDFLTIGSGATPYESVLATLTGSTVPEESYFTTSNQAWLRFYSDESATATGFSLSYEAVTVEASGELIGSVTITLAGETSNTFTIEDAEMFRNSIAGQLNTYCMAAQANCEADSNGQEFTPDDVHITSITEGESGVMVTFWVSDPNDPMGVQAGLTAEQLSVFLVEYETAIEENVGPSFDFQIEETSGVAVAIEEPWVIGVVVGLGFCFLLLVIVLVRDCCRDDDKAHSIDSLQMQPQGEFGVDAENNEKMTYNSAYTGNVYYQPEAAIVEDETNGKTKSKSASPPPSDSTSSGYSTPPPPKPDSDVVTTSFTSDAEIEGEAVYSVPNKSGSKREAKADVEQAAEATLTEKAE